MKKTSKSERTREFIIEHTAGIFNTKGYAGTSMSDLTEATKLTKGSIYGNFENKEEVALAAFDYNYNHVIKTISQKIGEQTTCKDKLMVYVDVYQHFLLLPFVPGGCPVLNTAVEADDTHPALRKKASDAVLSWKDSLCSLLKKGMANGEFRADIDIEQVAFTIIAIIEGGIMIGKVTGQVKHMHKVLKSLEELIQDLA